MAVCSIWIKLCDMPIVSVVIPFYSSIKGLLIKSVNSALAQNVMSIEVIVVDDCSPVSAQDELSSIADSRLRIVRHAKNSNGGIARNTGIDAASAEFVAFLDYDDVWYPDKLEKQLALFRQAEKHHVNPVIYSRCKIIDGKRQMIRPTRAIADNEAVGDYLFCARQIIQTSGIFLKTEVAKTVRFDDLKRHQDYQFCLSLEHFGCKFFMLEQPTYEFVQIPKLNDYKFSLLWLDRYSCFISSSAKKGFMSLVVIRSMANANLFWKAFVVASKERLLMSYLKSIAFRCVKFFLKKFRLR